MPDYGTPLEFGLSVTPDAGDPEGVAALTALAETLGLDLIGVQDHPYQPGHLETWTLISHLATRTSRIRFIPVVADLALRPPAMLAKAAATLAHLTGGRIDLGVGAGGIPDAITGMGGPARTPGEAVEATGEALRILRAALTADGPVVLRGRHHDVRGYQPGPRTLRPVPLWLGAVKPRMLALTGGLADGWVCELNIYRAPSAVPAAQAAIDRAARDAGREPSDVRRMYNVLGSVGSRSAGQGLNGPVPLWVDTLAEWAVELGFDTFVFWPTDPSAEQVRVFAEEVVPRVRAKVAELRLAR